VNIIEAIKEWLIGMLQLPEIEEEEETWKQRQSHHALNRGEDK
jgi:hypothetical protein